MDITQMLPLLMMMNGDKGQGGAPDMSALLSMLGGGFGGKSKPSTGGGSMPDMATLMQMMSLLNNGGKGNQSNKSGNANTSERVKPLNPDLSNIVGMLSPEMLSILSNLARGK